MGEEAEARNGYCSSSSGEEDGDAAWRAAIDSIAGTTSYITSFVNENNNNDDRDHKPKTQKIKHYQLKVSFLNLSCACVFAEVAN